MDSTSYAAAVAANVVSAIESSGKSVLEVATLAAIPRTTLHRRLLGGSPFSVAEVRAIANALDIEPLELMTVQAASEAVAS